VVINRYRFTVADGDPSWSKGWRAYKEMYAHVWDRLRFHRGKGFQLDARPAIKLVDVEDELHKLLDAKPKNTIITITSVLDGYKVKAERLEAQDLHGQDILDHLRNAIGTPYVLGGATLAGMDCSGSTLWSHAFEGITLPHKASWQHDLFRQNTPGFDLIDRSKILPGDLIFLHNDDHVATYLDGELGGRVIDAEPHDTGAPTGWPSSYLGVGLRVRPMSGNYYCAWQYSNGIGRIEAINGPP
jgi:hypothetical protein